MLILAYDPRALASFELTARITFLLFILRAAKEEEEQERGGGGGGGSTLTHTERKEKSRSSHKARCGQ